MEGDLQRTLGENVRAIRKERRLSQEAYAHLIGRNRTYVGSIERGERNLRLRTVEWLAELVGAEPLQLLTPPAAKPAPALAPPSPQPEERRGDEGDADPH